MRSPTPSATSRTRSALCEVCFNLAEGPRCTICSDERRDPALICVVEEPGDVIPVERTHEYRGRYHVLGGALSPIDGVEPDELRSPSCTRASSGPTRPCARSCSPRTRRPRARRPRCTSPTACAAGRRPGGHPARLRPAGRRRPRVRRRGHPRPRVRRPPRGVARGHPSRRVAFRPVGVVWTHVLLKRPPRGDETLDREVLGLKGTSRSDTGRITANDMEGSPAGSQCSGSPSGRSRPPQAPPAPSCRPAWCSRRGATHRSTSSPRAAASKAPARPGPAAR